ncbi:helix-turn-helix domain-containing protein [Streptomyces sp. NBC_00053]|uniref:helix-turn-helix domain-containing protein n=1 Tax=unclassified Streptomyces TaxID=2593676 RepID=UPI001F14F594|nr:MULTISPECIES: helix-turn-helix domain-containing protein [unclassified Streptomyces]WSG55554.1 helix-turn-helix domain-containing protein [Streptomyces sp. NBC_01732]WSX06693.1 helix-turn-helix domain-containing protein [Streptomyces sp. NBC_00987]MCX4391455.1 helix-turn-helix domain-containing protein [Streptomyces sp. NBC_01767]MCX5098082.1 helix-turn-helix domain-containing protein [Streptomyces sp. NBC_00439]MCX5165402.1 helix-turn-helix domain-containing protein [Streptomyces sp. NBC_0
MWRALRRSHPGHLRRVRAGPAANADTRRHGRRPLQRQAEGQAAQADPRQQAHLIKEHRSGEHTIADLAELFSVSRATVYRVLERGGS